jgi:methyl-accepting chemotaxis protein/DNA-directed RNA polymerase subunit RPC12/RpoP
MEYVVTASMHFRAMHLLTGDPENDKKLLLARQDFNRHMGYLSGVVDSQGQAILGKLNEATVPFLVSGQKVDRLASTGDLAGAMKVHLEEEHPNSHVLEGLARDLIRAAETRRTASLEEVERERQMAYAVAGAAGLGSFGLALFLGYILSWSVLGGLGRLQEHLRRVSRGDFSQEVTVPNGDELRDLAGHANTMMHELARARTALIEQNQALTAQAKKVEELNRRLEERVRQQSTELQAARRPDRDASSSGGSRTVDEQTRVFAPVRYRCEACGSTAGVTRDSKGAIRCPRCGGTRLVQVAPELA